MPAYLMVRIDADDPSQLKEYQNAAPPIVARYGGKFIVRGGATATLEGPHESRRIVVIEFPDMARAQAYYQSAEYAEARKLREGVARFECVAVEGLPQALSA